MTADVNRREFLQQAALATSALAISGFASEATADSAPSMTVAQWKGEEPTTPEALQKLAIRVTEKAIEGFGGLGRVIAKGNTVWIKPNINFHRTPEFAANTNPDVVATIVKKCFEAGAGKVQVGDNSSFGSDKSYPMSGIEAAAKAAGAEVVYLKETTFKEYPINGKVMPKWLLSPEIVEADVLINVPVAKNHPLPKFSGCMKNLMGIAGGNRSQWHDTLADHLCDLVAFVKPKLNIVDAIRVLTAGPPRGGNLDDVKFIGAIAISPDYVALDAWGAEQLQHKPLEIESIAKAVERGLGQADYSKLLASTLSVNA